MQAAPPSADEGTDRPDGRRPQGEGRAGGLLGMLLALLAALVAGGLGLPWSAASVVFAVVALVLGVRALHRANRASAGPRAIATVSVGIGLAGLVLLQQVPSLLLWPVQWEYEQCLASALSRSAEAACASARQDELDRLVREGFGGAPGR